MWPARGAATRGACSNAASRRFDRGGPVSDELGALTRRLERERKARREAETIAERVTGELYETVQQLRRLNDEFEAANKRLEEANQTMKEFVAVASHDMRG